VSDVCHSTRSRVLVRPVVARAAAEARIAEAMR
jgi:hypothetical protein